MKCLMALKHTHIPHTKEDKNDYSALLESTREFNLRYSLLSDYSFLPSAISKTHSKD